MKPIMAIDVPIQAAVRFGLLHECTSRGVMATGRLLSVIHGPNCLHVLRPRSTTDRFSFRNHPENKENELRRKWMNRLDIIPLRRVMSSKVRYSQIGY